MESDHLEAVAVDDKSVVVTPQKKKFQRNRFKLYELETILLR
jgi:hypothetical protein